MIEFNNRIVSEIMIPRTEVFALDMNLSIGDVIDELTDDDRYSRNGGHIMSKKIIVTIARQFGSGGREIGERIAEELGFPLIDKELIKDAAAKPARSPTTPPPRAIIRSEREI